VEVELVPAEPKGATAAGEGDRLHAEHPDIEVHSLIDVGDGEDQMVDSIDDDRYCWRAHEAIVAASMGWSGHNWSTPPGAGRVGCRA
jgi:hypothetical protein